MKSNNKKEIIIDEYPLKLSKWQYSKLWLWQRRNYKRITIWIAKDKKKE